MHKLLNRRWVYIVSIFEIILFLYSKIHLIILFHFNIADDLNQSILSQVALFITATHAQQ